VSEVQGLGEFGLLQRIKPYLAARSGDDDAAVLPDDGEFAVVSCDMFVEGVHFDLAWMTAADAGWRSLALALGDLAAKGATPSWALVSLAMPRRWAVENLDGLYQGMSELARQSRFEIVGGDMSSIDGPAVVSITVAGRTDTLPLQRSQAMPGWSVAVSGPLGASAHALRERRPLRLLPRLEEGRRLNQLGLCCGDISDGLLREMEKFAFMAHTGCLLHAAQVPVSEGATLEDALTGGEEAELVCTGPEELIQRAGLHSIGVLTADQAINVVGSRGEPVQVTRSGYDHFA
jgi:thiamine-monophosphate kinase